MKEGVRGLPAGETENRIQRWEYDTRFKNYLYRIAVLGHDGVESIGNFPSRIELNDAWHNALARMKAESRDGRERWVPVGMKADRSPEFIPGKFVRGRFTSARTLTRTEIAEEYGIVHVAGDIHSHLTDWFNSLGVKLIVTTRLVKDYEGFSTIDLHRMVNGNNRPMTGVVEKTHNYFAFRTAETKDLPADSELRSGMDFSRHWYRKYGGYFLGKSRHIFWPSPRFSARALNIGIAEAYNLALYRGKPGDDLVREYP